MKVLKRKAKDGCFLSRWVHFLHNTERVLDGLDLLVIKITRNLLALIGATALLAHESGFCWHNSHQGQTEKPKTSLSQVYACDDTHAKQASHFCGKEVLVDPPTQPAPTAAQ